MKLAEYQARAAALVDDDGNRRVVAYAEDGTKVVIHIKQPLLRAKEYEIELAS